MLSTCKWNFGTELGARNSDIMKLLEESTVEPRFTNVPVYEQFGSRTNFPSKNLGWRTVSRITNTQADNSGWRQAESIGAGVSVAG
jgi:hypothetical protein